MPRDTGNVTLSCRKCAWKHFLFELMIFTQRWLEFQYQRSCTQAKGDSYSAQWQQLRVSFQLRAAVYLSDLSNKPQPSEAHEPEITWSDVKRTARIGSADRRPGTGALSLLNHRKRSFLNNWKGNRVIFNVHSFVSLNHAKPHATITPDRNEEVHLKHWPARSAKL